MCARSSWIAVVALSALEIIVWSCRRPNVSSVPTSSLGGAPAAPAVRSHAVAPSSAQLADSSVHNPRDESRVAVEVTEKGFVPDRIPAEVGKPITLIITRKTDKTCAREILFGDQPGKTELPLGKAVEATFTPQVSGQIPFGCAMGMMVGGTLDVR